MNEVIKAILSRRSIRAYTEETISEDTIKTLIACGMAAPSAFNRRPFHFVSITDKSVRVALKDKSMFGKMMEEAPLVIAVCGDKLVQPVHDFLIEDCSAAVQNILLAAHGLGLGAVWIGVFALTGWQKFITKTLKLPAHVLPVALISIGHPNQTRKDRDRFEEGKWHRETW